MSRVEVLRHNLHDKEVRLFSPLMGKVRQETANFLRFDPLTGRIYTRGANKLWRENSSIEAATFDLIELLKPHLNNGEIIDDAKRKAAVLGELFFSDFVGQEIPEIIDRLRYEGLLPGNQEFVESVVRSGRYLELATPQAQALSFLCQLFLSGNPRDQYIGMLGLLYSERKVEKGNLEKAREYFAAPPVNPTWRQLQRILDELSEGGEIGRLLDLNVIRGGIYRVASALCLAEIFDLEEKPQIQNILNNLIADKNELRRIRSDLSVKEIISDYDYLYPEKTAEALLAKFQRCHRIIDRCLNLEVIKNYGLPEEGVPVQQTMF